MSLANTLPAPFQITPVQTALAVKYRNEKLIADAVLPRVPVDAPNFNYSLFNKQDSFTVPNTKVGRKSEVPEVDYSATITPAIVDDHGLDEVVPRRDTMIAQAMGNFIDPKLLATEQIADLLALDREVRVANLVTASGSYAAANKSTLSGTSQWSDFTNSDPLAAMLTALDGMLMRANQVVLGRAVATKLQTHPKLLAAFHGNQGQYGVMPLSFLATLLGVDEVLVGEGWVNTAKKGQTPSMSRVWGKSAALLYKAPVSIGTDSMSFGITAQWGSRIAGTYFNEKLGLRGSDVVRVGESVKEIIMANDLGYLFINAVA